MNGAEPNIPLAKSQRRSHRLSLRPTTKKLWPLISIPSFTLGQIVDEAGFNRFSVICDNEGAKMGLVAHELGLLADRAVFILVEIHPENNG